MPSALVPDRAAFMLSHPAHLIAMGFGTGLSPFAPGTVGTLLGYPIYWLLVQWLSPAGILAVAAGLFAIGVWACQRTGRALGVADHGSMVWDEVVAFLVILAFTPHTLGWQVAAFFLFRFFDVVKPPPVRYFDRTIKNGFGVMLDDILAAVYTLVAIAIGVRLLGS